MSTLAATHPFDRVVCGGSTTPTLVSAWSSAAAGCGGIWALGTLSERLAHETRSSVLVVRDS